MNKKLLAGVYLMPALFAFKVSAQELKGYQTPPKELASIIENTVNRNVLISGKGNYLAILQEPGYPSIKEISQPLLKLAGLRIHAANSSSNGTAKYSSVTIKKIDSSKEVVLSGIPKDAKVGHLTFSPTENQLAFAVFLDNEIQLWVASTSTGIAQRLTNFSLNDTYGKLLEWTPDGNAILAKFQVDYRKPLPQQSFIPDGPIITENLGEKSPARTYQDLLKNQYDELLFDHHLTSQIKMVYLNGQAVNFNRPGIYKNFSFSPDGNMVMIWTVTKPYSYHVPVSRFPYDVEIFDKYGKLIKKLAQVPLADKLPNGFDAVIKGPREFQWRADKPQTYIWVEAQDLGDPSERVSIRDIVYMQNLMVNDKPVKLASCYLRFNDIMWGDDQIAIITERWWKTRAERRVFIKPGNLSYRVNLWDRYYEDAYSDPGQFVTVKNEFNKNVLLLEYNSVKRLTDPSNINIFSISEGASGLGNRPFLLKFNVKTKITDTLFRSKAPFYEKPIYFTNQNKLLISRESNIEPTNYYHIDLNRKNQTQLTFFPNPNPELFGIIKRPISYKRADGLNLNATLYLPKDYHVSKGRLPVLMWAYPREFKTVAAAGQVKGSPYQFTRISWASPVFWVTQGFAVLDNVDMPIVGESNDQPNDTFIEQLKDNAFAAISKLNDLGVADPKRIAIGGHSYGAFMTANLLAHTNYFTAGIARSGAYNRTLTPFGFQAEERTYWENPDVYYKMSPFSYADKVKTPLLLIHGEADDNSGTFPMQSERFYSALKGHGATSRLVLLPAEAHSYKAKESVLHTLWEMDTWLKTYVRDKKDITTSHHSSKK
ncbi:S9 family peptidase [Pedobacter glucosidilyticus]|uniref:S9 family peptidase n=1 Tax=Pedobacter glucosidilyticus TaxID=1122941 RepID=UPI0026EF01D3|nr:prolyl oligopeptidase family serine peptidase [Pedobacter glucosidilyticus]